MYAESYLGYPIYHIIYYCWFMVRRFLGDWGGGFRNDDNLVLEWVWTEGYF